MANVDNFGDSYTSPVNVDELQDVHPRSCLRFLTSKIITKMTIPNRMSAQSDTLLNKMFQEDDEVHSLGRLFAGCITYLDRGESGICRFVIPLHVILMQ